MQITDVRIRKVEKEGKMKAVVSITIDEEFVVHDIKVIEGEKGLFIAMPSRKAADGEDRVVGYAFCVLQVHRGERVCPDMTTLYLDDLCVDQACRGQRVGSGLYQAVLALARERGCYNVTLNVWTCNQTAMDFYRRCGLQVQKTGMEVIL